MVPASKFIIALICFIMINTSIGYMDKLKNPVFALLLSVICAFLPGGFTLIVLSAFILIQLYVIAPEFALLVLCVMLLMYLLYFRYENTRKGIKRYFSRLNKLERFYTGQKKK